MSAADQQLSASQSLPGCFQRLQQVQQEYNGLHSEIAALRDEIAVQEKVEKAGGEGDEAARQRLIHLRQKELMLMASAKVMQERMLKLEEQITKLTPGAAAGELQVLAKCSRGSATLYAWRCSFRHSCTPADQLVRHTTAAAAAKQQPWLSWASHAPLSGACHQYHACSLLISVSVALDSQHALVLFACNRDVDVC